MEARVAIVTGASRGLGRTIALELAEAGCQVVLAARDVASLEEVAQAIRTRSGVAEVVPADLAALGGPQKVVDRAMEVYERVDVLVNNAGIAPQLPIDRMSDEQWDTVMALNVGAAFRGARAVAPIFREAGRGRLINIASVFGLVGRSGFSAYGASKGAMINLTRVLAAEWAKFGAQVNAVAPGYISTDVNAEMRENKAFVERVLARIPAKRMGEAHEVANLVRYLALDAPDFLTGQVIAIDGGESAS